MTYVRERKLEQILYFGVNISQLYIEDTHCNIQKLITEKSIGTFIHSRNNAVQKTKLIHKSKIRGFYLSFF